MYQLTNHGVFRNDGTFIPLDPANRDCAEYLEWVSKGNVPKPESVFTPDPVLTARLELEELERETMMNKGMREFFLVSMQDMAIRRAVQMEEAGIEAAPLDILNATPAWVRLVEINKQAAALEKEANP